MIPPNHGAFVITYVYFDYIFKIHKHFKVKWPSSKALFQGKLKNVLDEEPDGTLSLDFKVDICLFKVDRDAVAHY